MSTAHRHVNLPRSGAPVATLVAAWSISGGARLVWTLSVAQSASAWVPLGAEARLEEKGGGRVLSRAAADDVDLVEDSARAMVHARVRIDGNDVLLATFRREADGWRPCYASTTALRELGLRGGRYEFEAG